jgi:hypothetical protein
MFSLFFRALIREVANSLSGERVSFRNFVDDVGETFCGDAAARFLRQLIVNPIFFVLTTALAHLEHDPCHEAKGDIVEGYVQLFHRKPVRPHQAYTKIEEYSKNLRQS